MQPSTRFGTAVDSPARAASLLRALASRHGVPLQEVSHVALAAACLAAEGWMEVLGADSLESTSRFGSSAQTSLAAILDLAARGVVPEPNLHEEQADLERFLPLLERYNAWLEAWFPDLSSRSDVILFAAACLAAGSDSRLGALAELLETWSIDV